MTLWEARMGVVQAALDLARLEVDPFKETRDPNYDAGLEMAEDNLDHAIFDYIERQEGIA